MSLVLFWCCLNALVVVVLSVLWFGDWVRLLIVLL